VYTQKTREDDSHDSHDQRDILPASGVWNLERALQGDGLDARAGVAESVMTGIAGFRAAWSGSNMPREPCQVGIAYKPYDFCGGID
jgi:hypothetical protein